MEKNDKYKITNMDNLKAFKKASRENNIPIKPTITTDKKKEDNKNKCKKPLDDE
jgi:hypothetical protein